MEVEATLQTRSVSNSAMGFVLVAIRNGWLSAIKQGEQPYFAFRYIIEVINTALRGDNQLITNAPVAFWDFLAAIKPKTEGFKTSQVQYGWEIVNSALGDSVAFQYSAVNPAYVFWGTDLPFSTINGYPELTAPPVLPAYTTAIGAQSFTSLLPFLGKSAMAQATGNAAGTGYLSKDTSAFAVCYPEIGESLQSEGGAAVTIYSERKIASPLLSKYAQYQPTGEYYRGWAKAGKNAGSSTYVIPRMLEFDTPKMYSNKASPIFKFYNFDEFFYVLSTTLVGAIENFYANLGNTNLPSCPLTSQDTQILLRQAILAVTCNHLGQDLLLGNAFYPMVPFSVGPNGAVYASGEMLLPTVLAENIRASCRRLHTLNKKNDGKFTNYISDHIPLLCRPSTLPQVGNFSTTIGGLPYLLYAGYPEETVNIIDLSVLRAGSPVFFSATGDIYGRRLADWNSWISKLQSCLSPLTDVGGCSGIIALSTVFYTNTVQDVTINQQDVVQLPLPQGVQEDPRITLDRCLIPIKKIVGKTRAVKNVGSVYKMTAFGADPVTPNYLNFWTEKEVVMNQCFTSEVFKIIKQLILPTHLSSGEQNQASLQAWQSFMVEPYLFSRSAAGGGGGDYVNVFPKIESRLKSMAQLDVKAFTSGDQQNEIVLSLIEMGKNGRGGFFANVAGFLAGAFIPGSGEMVKNLAGQIGL